MNILLWAVFADAAKIAERLDHKDDSVAAQKKSEVIKHAIYAHNWMNLVEPGWKGATTTTECMGMGTRGWGDESHPDTAIAYLFSAYILRSSPSLLSIIFRRPESTESNP